MQIDVHQCHIHQGQSEPLAHKIQMSIRVCDKTLLHDSEQSIQNSLAIEDMDQYKGLKQRTPRYVNVRHQKRPLDRTKQIMSQLTVNFTYTGSSTEN
jgi:hypothetical protein